MSRKTTELYVKVFQKVQQLVPTCAMADFEEVSVAGFQHVYPDAGVAGCCSSMRKQLSTLPTSVWSGVALSGLVMSGLAFLIDPLRMSAMHCITHIRTDTHFQLCLIDWLLLPYSAGSFYQGSFYEYFRVRVDHTGLVDWSFGGPLEISCPMDTTLYPFDLQRCYLILENWVYSVDYVDLRNSSDNLRMDDHHDSGRVLMSWFISYKPLIWLCLNRNMRESTSSWTVAPGLCCRSVVCHDPALCRIVWRYSRFDQTQDGGHDMTWHDMIDDMDKSWAMSPCAKLHWHDKRLILAWQTVNQSYSLTEMPQTVFSSVTKSLTMHIGLCAGVWQLVGTEVLRKETTYSVRPGVFYPQLYFVVHLQRKPRYYLINVTLPCVFLTFIALLVSIANCFL